MLIKDLSICYSRKYLEILTEYCILALILGSLYLQSDSLPLSLFFLALSVDGLFSSIGFIRINLSNQDLTQSQTLNQLKSLYRLSATDRYIYYGVIEIFYRLLSIIFWNSQLKKMFYWIFIANLSPLSVNWVTQNIFGGFFYKLDKIKTHVIRTTVARQVATIINFLSESCVNLRPNVTGDELVPLFRNIDQTVNFFNRFLLNFLIATVVHFTRTTNNRFYHRLIKIFYNFQTGQQIHRMNEKKAKELFTYVVVKRKWRELLKPDVLQTIFFIYKINDDTDFIQRWLTDINYTIIQTLAIWTLSKFFNQLCLAPLVSIVLLLYKKIVPQIQYRWSTLNIHSNHIKKVSQSLEVELDEIIEPESLNIIDYNPLEKNVSFWGKYPILTQFLFKVVVLLLSLITYGEFSSKFLILSTLSEFGPRLVFNNITFSLIENILDQVLRCVKIIFHYNKYNTFLISSFVYIQINRLFINTLTFPISVPQYLCDVNICKTMIINPAIIGGTVYFGVNSDNLLKTVILFILTTIGLISDYDLVHTGFLVSLGYVLINLLHFFDSNLFNNFKIGNIKKILESDQPPDRVSLMDISSLKVFESYYPTSVQSNAQSNEQSSTQLSTQLGTQSTQSNTQSTQSNTQSSSSTVQSLIINPDIVINSKGEPRNSCDSKVKIQVLEETLPLGLNIDMSRSYYIKKNKLSNLRPTSSWSEGK